jgi:putative CocE/NonD family hydrolase
MHPLPRWSLLLPLLGPLAAAPALAQGAAGIDIRFGQKVPLRDGVELNATLYFPRGGEARRPVILAMTPYIADRYHEFVLPVVRRGYVAAVLDVRGRGSSGGVFTPFAQEAKDGYDVIEWIAAQPWSDGRIGMMGGSYGGFNQWSIAKERPPHLVTIAPTASSYMGIDFPALGGIWPAYAIQWLTFTSGRAPNASIFGDGGFWRDKFRQLYLAHLPYAKLDSVVGNPSPSFQTWIQHPDFDAYWASMAGSPEQLAALTIPIFTRTGMYDDDQVGAMEHYRTHMKYGSAEARAKHYLMIGPWDHAGTRTPQRKVGGLSFGPASVFDMGELEADWYDWTIRGGARPAKLPKRVAYYVSGAEVWKYADDLDQIGRNPTPFYLGSAAGSATDLLHSGTLSPAPHASPADRWVDDPLDTTPGATEGDPPDYVDQSYAAGLNGRGVVYHSAPFDHEVEISGFPSLTTWIRMDVPDADFYVALYEITATGRSMLLDEAQIRARYRESRARPVLVTPGQPTKIVFDRFRFMSRRLAAGSRLRLLVMSPNSIQLEKNYHSGGRVALETAKDARTAHLELLHDAEHRSVLLLPVAGPGA